MTETWEIIVWDGSVWLRFPDIQFTSPESALASAERILMAPCVVRTTRDLNAHGLPREAPSGRFPLDSVKRTR